MGNDGGRHQPGGSGIVEIYYGASDGRNTTSAQIIGKNRKKLMI